MFKRVLTVLLVVTLLSFSRAAFAEDLMSVTLRDALYGGVIGALLGTAVLLLTDEPEDHLDYIPAGAGVGILVGAAYGIASTGPVGAVAEVDENGRFAFNLPQLTSDSFYDKITDTWELIGRVDLLRLRF